MGVILRFEHCRTDVCAIPIEMHSAYFESYNTVTVIIIFLDPKPAIPGRRCRNK